jgi:hypothetical protein
MHAAVRACRAGEASSPLHRLQSVEGDAVLRRPRLRRAEFLRSTAALGILGPKEFKTGDLIYPYEKAKK